MENLFTTLTGSETLCPHCGERLNAATGPSGTPSEGDLSICIECLSVLIFDKDIIPREMSDEVWASIPTETIDVILDIQQAIARGRFDILKNKKNG